jgi:5-amino-6-(5-phospho-D-ribitylamino)uracil phosphatase
MPVRLLALDLDGTLLDSHGRVSARNLRAIDAARACGVRVALVTGRRFRDARPLALELGIDVPLVAHNGALTKHARTLETVATVPLPLETARAVLRFGRAHKVDPLVSDDPEGPGLLVYEHLNEANRPLLEYIEWARRIHGAEAEQAVLRVASLEDYLDHPPVHIAFSGTDTEMLTLSDVLRQELAGLVKLMVTIYPAKQFGLVDVIHPEVSKGTGLAAVAREYDIARAEVMAMGDNHNDVEMLEFAGTRVIVANAEPPLREIAGVHVTASNDEDGVAQAIEEFILNNHDEHGLLHDE